MKIQITIVFIVFALCSCVSPITPRKIETPAPAPTQKANHTTTALATFDISEQIVVSILSPDGTKIIQSTDWVTYEILSAIDKKIIWTFSYDRGKFAKEEDWKYLPEAGYIPFYWSTDGRYIYVSAHQGWDGGVKYFGNAFGAENGVARFDTATGVMTEILAEMHGGFYTFGISPDGKSIIYTYQNETPIVLRLKDLSTGKEKILLTFSNNILDVGEFVWLPEMNKVLFQTMAPNGNDFLLLDLENRETQVIIREFKEPINFDVWKEPNKADYSNSKDVVWQLDMETKTLTLIGTATPTP